MSPCGTLPAIALLAAISAGCGEDFYARRLVEVPTTPGKVNLAALGTGEYLIRRSEIDLHRRIPVDKDVVIDTWVIRSRRRSSVKGTVVIIHGLLDSKARYLGLGKRLGEMGYDVALLDLRAHGRSTGKYVTYGALERLDVKSVVDSLLARRQVRQPVFVFGVSLGASTAIQYAAIDPRCRGVVAVAPFKSLRDIGRAYVPLMSEQTYRGVLSRAGEIAGFDPDDASAIEAAKTLTCSLTIIHGTLDAVVPYSHGKAIYDAAHSPKSLIDLPGVGHSTILLGREQWFADQLDRMASKSSVENRPTTPP